MIKGLGIDAVEIKRFEHWTLFTQKQLLRIFSEQEIAYSQAHPLKTAERLAARFAAKEAFYKALSQLQPQKKIPFLTLCKAVSIISQGPPHLKINWDCFFPNISAEKYTSHISITHTKTMATTVVIIEEK